MALKVSTDVVRPTTLISSPRLSKRAGCDLTLASETFQQTGSFKFRAAYNLAATVSHNHIITASSGNFGQALAYACSLLGKKCTVVMPSNSASVKVDAVREYGGIVEPVETQKISRAQRVQQLAQEFPDAYVASAYDDRLVIEGNATLGRELAAVSPKFDAVIAPVGGGGLSAGIVEGLRQAGATKTLVFGAEPAIANDAARTFRGDGTIVAHDCEPQTIADGARTVSLGKCNWEVLREGLSDILEVSEDDIRDAVRQLFILANLKAEPTGAVSLGALLANHKRFAGQKVCCVISGGNVDPKVYQEIIAPLAR